MIRPRLRLWTGFTLGTTILIVVLAIAMWSLLRKTGPQDQNWVLLSIRGVEFRTNAGVASPMAAVRVSNHGPGAVDFRLCWFECRAKQQKTLMATNPFVWVIMTLGPGESTNLTLNVKPADLPAADCWCCGEVLWAERESFYHRWHRTVDWVLNTFDLTKNPRWYSRELQQGSAIAGNVDTADYFRTMYGKTNSQWLALARKFPWLMQKPINNGIYYVGTESKTPQERAMLQAETAFADFCRTSTDALSGGN